MLRNVLPSRLLRFLTPWTSYFRDRSVELPATFDAGQVPYDELVHVFLNPDVNTPKELVDALFLIDEMSTTEGADKLLAACERRGRVLDCDDMASPADIAIQVWLQEPAILELQHAEHHIEKRRSYTSFRHLLLEAGDVRPDTITDTAMAELAKRFDEWFERKKRGRGSKIFTIVRHDGIWLLVRHGQTFRREERFDVNGGDSVVYRPVKYDIAVYAPHRQELRVNAGSRGEVELYRRSFSRHFFGIDEAFSETGRYTLEPLIRDGEASLVVADVPGIEWIQLRWVKFHDESPPWKIATVEAANVFDHFRGPQGLAEAPGELVRAKFRIKFHDSTKPRSVTIQPPDTAVFARDDDAALVEKWLENRGFLCRTRTAHAHPVAILASR